MARDEITREPESRRVRRRGCGLRVLIARRLRIILGDVVSIYRVHFKWKEKDLILRAKSLDLTHPYFVSITGLVFPEGKKLIIDPSEDDVRRMFGKADHLMIPFQTVALIEEFKDGEPEASAVVRKFRMVEDDKPKSTEPPPAEDLSTSD